MDNCNEGKQKGDGHRRAHRKLPEDHGEKYRHKEVAAADMALVNPY